MMGISNTSLDYILLNSKLIHLGNSEMIRYITTFYVGWNVLFCYSVWYSNAVQVVETVSRCWSCLLDKQQHGDQSCMLTYVDIAGVAQRRALVSFCLLPSITKMYWIRYMRLNTANELLTTALTCFIMTVGFTGSPQWPWAIAELMEPTWI